MKTFVAIAVVASVSAVVAALSSSSKTPPTAPQAVTIAAQPFQAAGAFQQVGDGSAVAGITIHAVVGGVPGAGGYNLHSMPVGSSGDQLWQTTLSNGSQQVVIQVWRRTVPPPPAASPTITWWGTIHQANFGPPSLDCLASFPINGADFAGSGSGPWSCGGNASITIQ